MAGILGGWYPLFCDFAHPDESIEAGTLAVEEYLQLKSEDESVWFSEVLQEKNNWPIVKKDLEYLNVLRRHLSPPTYDIEYIPIKDAIIMPITNLDKGQC